MAYMYNSGIEALGDGTIQWGTTAMKVAMVTSTYSFAKTDDTYSGDIDNEITSTGYTAGGMALAGESTLVDDGNNEVQFDATNTTWAQIDNDGGQPYAAVVYESSGGQLLCYNLFTTPPTPNGGSWTIVWSTEGVFEITNTG